MNFRGVRVAVVGLGLSHQALIRFLLEEGAQVTAFDRNPKAGEGVADLGVEFHLGGDYLDHLEGYPLICLTPGMPKNLPQVKAAAAAGAVLTGEIPLFLELCPAPVLGITGSAGKTTTSSLVAKILETAGREVHLGGNIGWPLIEGVRRISPQAVVVLELSSFQLQLCRKSPHWGVITNLSPNHLDVHHSFEEYAQAKANIFRHQGPEDWAILNQDAPGLSGWERSCPGKVAFFSREREVEQGAFLRGKEICLRVGGQEAVIDLTALGLPGKHNVENGLAAALGAFLAGADGGTITEGFQAFPGVEHRLERVAERGGVVYYNDSIATAPDRTMAALDTIDGSIILIAGGYDKGLDYEILGPAIRKKVRVTFLTGPTAGKIATSIGLEPGGTKVVRCANFAEAVAKARATATPGETVLLSPAAASFDEFRDYKERGRRFKELVSKP